MAFYHYTTHTRPDTQTPWWRESDPLELATYKEINNQIRNTWIQPWSESTSSDGLIRVITIAYPSAQAFLDHRASLTQSDLEFFKKRNQYILNTNQTVTIEWNTDGGDNRNLLLTISNANTETNYVNVINPSLPDGLTYS